jgi:hypothetical protein
MDQVYFNKTNTHKERKAEKGRGSILMNIYNIIQDLTILYKNVM